LAPVERADVVQDEVPTLVPPVIGVGGAHHVKAETVLGPALGDGALCGRAGFGPLRHRVLEAA
jgi:hypothetical protein